MGGFRIFTLAGVPVWVSPWYLLMLLYLGSRSGNVSFAVCITLSLLVHEMGHALVARRYSLGPEIVLTGFGGLTQHRPAATRKQEAFITIAGPAAGLALGGLSLWLLRRAPFDLSHTAHQLLEELVTINFFWSAFNLLPMWPLDGGQLFRLGCSKLFAPRTAARVTHITGFLLAAAVALLASQVSRGVFIFFVLALTAWENIHALMRNGRSGAEQPRDNPFAHELMQKAEQAYAGGDDQEAARLCQQLRGESNVPPELLAKMWSMLGVTATRQGRFEEALGYLRRAPDSPEVIEATAQCFYQLEMFDALRALTETRAFAHLPVQTRELIVRTMAES